MLVEGEVLNNFLRFIGILIAEVEVGGAVNLAFKIKGDMIIENLDLKPTIDAMMRDYLKKIGGSSKMITDILTSSPELNYPQNDTS
ncbi:hypothetical protein Tco_0117917 [Tanacetum coccineum]